VIARRGGAALALVSLLAAGCATSLVENGRLREEPYRDLVATTARVRGIPFEAPVTARVVTAAEVPAITRAAAEAEVGADQIAAYQEALTTFGVWPDGRDLGDVFAAVAGEEVAGLYVPPDRTLYVVRDARMPFSARLAGWLLRRDLVGEMVLAHELVHALQHQAYPGYFDRDRFLHDQDDLANALGAALEGDATFHGLLALGDLGVMPGPNELGAELVRDAETRRDGALADAPAWIRLTLGFPYAAGYALAYREGPALLDAPPASTEQALHASRRREAFGVIDLAGARARLPAGCAFVHENTMGELGLRVLLRDLAPSGDAEAARAAAEDAAEGWDGDRYLVAHCDGQRALFWWIDMDGEDDAIALESALRAVAPAMAAHAGTAAPQVSREGASLRVVSPVLAPVSDALGGAARRGRVETLDDAFGFFGQPPTGVGGSAVAHDAGGR
jgi:hypothetical protein